MSVNAWLAKTCRFLLLVVAEHSSSGSEPASPAHAPAAATAVADDSAAAEPAAAKVEREDWMTKSFPKAADPAATSAGEAAKVKVTVTPSLHSCWNASRDLHDCM